MNGGGEGAGGNREVPPNEILGGVKGNLDEEGGSRGKPGFRRELDR
jgi:hypothetical protein